MGPEFWMWQKRGRNRSLSWRSKTTIPLRPLPGQVGVAHLDVAINVELKWSVTKVGNDMIARSLEPDRWVDLDLGFPQVKTSERNPLEMLAHVRQVPQQESQRTEHFAILGKHGLALSEIDQATDCVARTKLWPVRLTYVLGGETVTVIAMVAP